MRENKGMREGKGEGGVVVKGEDKVEIYVRVWRGRVTNKL